MHDPVLLIRADASPQRGTGHVMRMIALAQAWRRRGGMVHLLSRELPPALMERAAAESMAVHDFHSPSGSVGEVPRIDAKITSDLAAAIGASWVVADGYDFTIPFQKSIQQAGLRLAIVTDFDYCSHWSCNIIVNQNPHAIREPYACSPHGCQKLLGTRFALLREELVHGRAGEASSGGESRRKRILVTLGGSDCENVTGQILSLLEANDRDALDIRVLIGGANPNRPRLEQQAKQTRHPLTLLNCVSDMAAQYRWADGVISAGGSSCWEWMYYRLPAALVVIADNQLPIYEEIVKAGLAVGLGTSAGDLDSARVTEFIDSIAIHDRQASPHRRWVDGYGADRVAAAMDSGIWLRQAENEDCKLYFDWANDPEVRQNSLQTKPILWDQHCGWFKEQLSRDDRYLMVAMRQEQPVGQIRLTRKPSTRWEVAFSVAAAARGCGVGGEILRLAIAWMHHHGHDGFVATVKQTNRASARYFERLGWDKTVAEPESLLHFRSV